MKVGRQWPKSNSLNLPNKNGSTKKPPVGHVISQEDAAKLMRVSVDSVTRAAKVARESPETFAAVKAGKMSLNKSGRLFFSCLTVGTLRS